MRPSQHIFRTRRQYNQWVGNQTLEDYALRFTAKRARRFSPWVVATTALGGAAAFLALEAIGGAITLSYGFTNAFWAMLTVGLVIFVTGLPITYHAAKYGVDIDLLTRGAGFGYLGSTITSLIYASFTFLFFAIEAAILAMALKALFGIPPALGYILCAVAVIPIVTHGITFISRFQVGTQYLWVGLQILAVAAIAWNEWHNIGGWMDFPGSGAVAERGGSFDLLLFGAAASILFALMAQIGEQVDYLRFLPPQEETGRLRWWMALVSAGPGWVFVGVPKMLLGSFLAWLALSKGVDPELAADPTHMYQGAYNYLTNSPTIALVLAGVMVIISQLKINVTNAYAGSIAWSNFFSRLTHNHPGRVVWLVFNVAIALLLMELGIYRALENILSAFAIIAVSWLGSLSADLMINKRLGLSPPFIEFKRAHLYDINPVGVGSMFVSTTIGMLCHLGVFGPVPAALTHFITLGCTFVMVPLIAFMTRGRYYIARSPDENLLARHEHECVICENHFETEDISHCPAYQGPICSLCCTLDSRCYDSCKSDARFSIQVAQFLGKLLPGPAMRRIDSRLGRFVSILFLISLANAAMLSLAYYHIDPQGAEMAQTLQELLNTLFFLLMIVFGVIAWLFLLAHESRAVAHEETARQTELLLHEIEAHRQTDRELQTAKEIAEAANDAKSRYLSGISHELRTPLQSILGYTQILARDERIPEDRRDSIAIIRRSGEYLADLIEGLLDISRIEAGKLQIHRAKVDLAAMLDEIVNMFSLQAAGKSISFRYENDPHLPRFVYTDGKRLRQILINLLSNAVKFTHHGEVVLKITYRNQVAKISVSDTGVGIAASDLQRIFNPFERAHTNGNPEVAGTGLGLTIVKLLSEIMGGDLEVRSTPGSGSTFTLSLMLNSAGPQLTAAPASEHITGFTGEQRTLLVVDDEPTHRSLMADYLAPLGFSILEAGDAEACLALLESHTPDAFLLDVSMPGMDGMELARRLRKRGLNVPIVMVSADAQERRAEDMPDAAHDAYMVKPIRFSVLTDVLSNLLGLTWTYAPPKPGEPKSPAILQLSPAAAASASRLRAYAEIGYTRGVTEELDQLQLDGILPAAALEQLAMLARQMRYAEIVELLNRSET
ncbi:ATP-binding protein [Haliea sp. E17]|uniref:ATP-binding protein n=1 Tax=Haliea sp. E17 TaxID=3401576 RepID=UPI003AACC9F8